MELIPFINKKPRSSGVFYLWDDSEGIYFAELKSYAIQRFKNLS